MTYEFHSIRKELMWFWLTYTSICVITYHTLLSYYLPLYIMHPGNPFFIVKEEKEEYTDYTKIRVDFTEKPFLILYNYLLSTCKMKVCEVIELYLCKWHTTVQHLYNNNSIKSFLFFIWWRYRLQKLVTRATNVLAVYQFPNK